MTEANAQTIKPGERFEMNVGGQRLILEPIPYRRMKVLLKMVFEAINEIQGLDNQKIMDKLPELMDEKLPKLLPLVFDPKMHPFMNADWIEDNLSLIHMRDIAEKTITINGLKDFFGNKNQPGAGIATPKEMTKTP